MKTDSNKAKKLSARKSSSFTDEQIDAAKKAFTSTPGAWLHESTLPDCFSEAIRAALEAADAAAWRPIETAPKLDRVFVSGWQKRSGIIAGYWWLQEDMTDENGIPMYSPSAKYWRPLPVAPTKGASHD